MKKVIIILIIVAVIIVGVWVLMNNKTSITPTTQNGAALGERCGGNMLNAPVCAAGLHCAPEPGSHLPFGDVGGTCVKD